MVGLNLSKIKIAPSTSESGVAPTEASIPPASTTQQAAPSAGSDNVPASSSTAAAPAPAKPMGLAALMAARARGESPQVAKPEPSKELVVAEPIQSEKVESTGPAAFQEKMRALDQMIGEVNRISQLEIDAVRGHIMEIMKDLKTYPEYLGMVRAKDTHNLMKYVQESYAQAQNTFVLANEKKTKKAASTAKKDSISLPADFGAAFGSGNTPVTKQKQIMDLSSLQGFNTDDIEAKK